ncbi:hypothetical protein GCM10027568_30320 [Humibacter soli]
MTATSTTAAKNDRRKHEVEALHATLITQVEQFASSDQWARFVRMAAAFHTYSLNNILLILAQFPNATRVAGYTRWQQLGRQVRKGEHGIRIFATRHTTHTNQPEDTDTEDDTTRKGPGTDAQVRYFPIVSVFDITQTDPIGPEADTELAQPLDGSNEHGITTPLTDYLTRQGWQVRSEPMHGTRSGYTNPTTRDVVIRSHVSPAQYAKTLLHETAHILAGHTNKPAEYVLHRGRMETEAEATTYITAALTGLDTTGYSIGYITGWTHGDTTIIKDTATTVLNLTHQLASIIQPTH